MHGAVDESSVDKEIRNSNMILLGLQLHGRYTGMQNMTPGV